MQWEMASSPVSCASGTPPVATPLSAGRVTYHTALQNDQPSVRIVLMASRRCARMHGSVTCQPRRAGPRRFARNPRTARPGAAGTSGTAHRLRPVRTSRTPTPVRSLPVATNHSARRGLAERPEQSSPHSDKAGPYAATWAPQLVPRHCAQGYSRPTIPQFGAFHARRP